MPRIGRGSDVEILMEKFDFRFKSLKTPLTLPSELKLLMENFDWI